MGGCVGLSPFEHISGPFYKRSICYYGIGYTNCVPRVYYKGPFRRTLLLNEQGYDFFSWHLYGENLVYLYDDYLVVCTPSGKKIVLDGNFDRFSRVVADDEGLHCYNQTDAEPIFVYSSDDLARISADSKTKK